MREKGQRHMVMPAWPGTDLVMIHPQFALAFFDGGLDRPAQARLAHQVRLGDSDRRIAQIKLDVGRVARAAAEDDPDVVARTTSAFAPPAHLAVIGPLAPSLIV